MKDNLTLTTEKNGEKLEWITIIEDGIPLWVPKKNAAKHLLIQELSQLFDQASRDHDDEPLIAVQCEDAVYEICYFKSAGLYLCEDLEGRYATLPSLTDAFWELVYDKKILSCKRL